MSARLEILSPGSGMTVQDRGRYGWKRLGVPRSGAMDMVSAGQANRLVGNGEEAALLELLFTGGRLRALTTMEAAITGAEVECNRPREESFLWRAGEEIQFGKCHSGVWSYLAVAGGLDAPRWLGSMSTYPAAGFGERLQAGMRLAGKAATGSSAIARRFVREKDYFREGPELPIYPGPEWDLFSAEARELFLNQRWTISPKSDRTGYRLEGQALESSKSTILSSPLSVGTIQVPPGGQPIVILRDGPTVGGYPRLAILGAEDVSRFTQCAPGTTARFKLIE